MKIPDTQNEASEEDDWVVFIPSKEYNTIRCVIEKLKEAQKEIITIVEYLEK